MLRKEILVLVLVAIICPQDVTPGKSCGSQPADIHFLLDSSGSIRSSDFQKQLDFVSKFVDGFTIGPQAVQIGVTVFSWDVQIQFWMNEKTDKDAIKAAIKQAPHLKATTNTGDALKHAREEAFTKAHGDRDDVTNILIVVTDGQSNDQDKTKHEANLVKQGSINVFAIGVGKGVDQTELQTIASDENSVFNVDNFDAFDEIESSLKGKACEEATCGVHGSKPVDMHFLVDASGSVTAANFPEQLVFIKKFAHDFNIGPKAVQIGVTYFNSNPDNKFWMNKYQDKASLEGELKRLETLPFRGGGTRTHLALELARTQAFTAANGDRPEAANILIILTDGKSWEPKLTKSEADLIKQKGITVFAIGVGTGIDQTELMEMASNAQSVYSVTNFAALDTIKESLRKTTCMEAGKIVAKKVQEKVCAPCPKGWTMLRGICYKYIHQKEKYKNAQKFCLNAGNGTTAQIAMPKSQEQEETILELRAIGAKAVKECVSDMWMGLTDKTDSGTWKWEDGTTYNKDTDYGNWARKMKWNGSKSCVKMRRHKAWKDENCKKKKVFVCQITCG